MQLNLCRQGDASDAKRALVTARLVQGRRPGQMLRPIDGVDMNEVRCTTRSGTLLCTYGLASCVAVVVVNTRLGFPFAALAHCMTTSDGFQLLEDVADAATEVHGRDNMDLHIAVCGGYRTVGTPAQQLVLRDGLLLGIQVYLEEADDERYLDTLDLSQFGLTRPYDDNPYSLLLACRDAAYDVVLADRSSILATSGAAPMFDDVGRMSQAELEGLFRCEQLRADAPKDTRFARHIVRMGRSVV